MKQDKKIGDYIILFGENVYRIKESPEVFFSNEFANEEQIKKAKALGITG